MSGNLPGILPSGSLYRVPEQIVGPNPYGYGGPSSGVYGGAGGGLYGGAPGGNLTPEQIAAGVPTSGSVAPVDPFLAQLEGNIANRSQAITPYSGYDGQAYDPLAQDGNFAPAYTSTTGAETGYLPYSAGGPSSGVYGVGGGGGDPYSYGGPSSGVYGVPGNAAGDTSPGFFPGNESYVPQLGDPNAPSLDPGAAPPGVFSAAPGSVADGVLSLLGLGPKSVSWSQFIGELALRIVLVLIGVVLIGGGIVLAGARSRAGTTLISRAEEAPA